MLGLLSSALDGDVPTTCLLQCHSFCNVESDFHFAFTHLLLGGGLIGPPPITNDGKLSVSFLFLFCFF